MKVEGGWLDWKVVLYEYCMHMHVAHLNVYCYTLPCSLNLHHTAPYAREARCKLQHRKEMKSINPQPPAPKKATLRPSTSLYSLTFAPASPPPSYPRWS